ncbi:MAG: chemotaxis protein CheB [Chromatiales bacterium]
MADASTDADEAGESHPSDFPVVAIGASAGGLEALKRFFSAMPAQSGLGFVVIPHLDPTHVSHLPELLRRHTPMPVEQAHDGALVQAEHVHIIPPNALLTIKGGVLHLGAAVARPGIPRPIDGFLRSLAEYQQERAICIICSGTGSDGTLGLKVIKAEGGLVMVQSPDTAEHDGMPRSAIATGLVDYVLPVEQMPAALLEYVEHAHLRGGPIPVPADTRHDPLHAILALLCTREGHDFRCYKKAMLLRRIQRRMGLNHIAAIGDYGQYLRDTPAELKALAKDLLIGVTEFFREPEAWAVLEAEVIPRLVTAKHPEAALRVWVTGCATGEEAYSIGMCLLEGVASSERNGKLQIFATDIDSHALEIARVGTYPEGMASSLAPERLTRFFTKADHSYRVKKELREAVVFAPQNLVTDAPFSRLDLIICRNLLIYLEPELQKKLIALFHFALNRNGYLFLGKSETVGQQLSLFEPLSKKWRIYRRSGPVRHRPVDFPLIPEALPGERPGRPRPHKPKPGDHGEVIRALLLARYAPAAVLVNRDCQTLYFHGQTDDYLVHPAGEPTDDLLAMAREGLRLKLRAALHRAMRDEQPAVVVTQVKRGGASRPVQVTVTPVEDQRQGVGLWLVTFSAPPAAEAEPAAPRAIEESAAVGHLEDELVSVKKELEGVVADLESANEELKVSNEEAMSMNEELQSTNEELETSKEELQSLNEELTTVNAQLEEKVTDLERTNNDLDNLLASTHIATLFFDREFRIKRYTPASTRLFNLIPSDLNRPVADIANKFSDAHLLSDAQRVLDTLTPIEREVRTVGGEWYIQRVLPYRTHEDRIEGVVVIYTEITELKRGEEALRDSEERFRTLAETVPDIIFTHRPDGFSDYTNPRFYELTGLPPGAADGFGWTQSLHPEDWARDRSRWRQALAAEQPYELKYRLQSAAGGYRWHLTRGRPIRDASGQINKWFGVSSDIDDLVHAQEALAQAQKMEAVGQLTGGIAHDFNNLLTVIGGNLQLLEARLQDDPAGQTLRDAAARAAERGAERVHGLLAFARRQVLQPQAVNLNEIVAGMMPVLRQTLGEPIEIALAPGADLWAALADPGQVEAALLNLALNARDAMPEGGRLVLKTANVTLGQDATVPEAEVTPGDYVLLWLSDTGEGMSEETKKHAFEPFFTTKTTGRGSGLGLSMVYGFARQSGGHVKVYSERGQGTTVKLYLPRAQDKLAATVARDPLPLEDLRGREAILVVEDDADVRALAVTYLSDLGYRALEAAEAQAALALFEAGEHIDLLFVDLVLPGTLDGHALALEANKRHPALQVLYTSGYPRTTIKLDEGARLLMKPYRREDLARAVRGILDAPPG